MLDEESVWYLFVKYHTVKLMKQSGIVHLLGVVKWVVPILVDCFVLPFNCF